MTGIPWNPLKKQVGNLAAKPQLTQGLASHEEERKLELSYVQLQDLEENSKKLHKEVKKYEECLTGLQRQEEKVGSFAKPNDTLSGCLRSEQFNSVPREP